MNEVHEHSGSADAIDRARAFIARYPWTFAKTMPQNPHEYVVRAKCRDDAAFDDMVLTIREHGKPVLWHGKRYTYLLVGGYEYWTMGSPVRETTIINRAKGKQA